MYFLLIPVFVTLAACQQEPKPRMNVLLVTFDTTRADFIGAYGKETASTATLDRMAASGTLFERAMSSNPVTQPAHSTILTGTYPLSHGVRDNGLFKLPDASETLAEILAANGYRTGAAIGGFPLVKSFGLNQGFEFYDDHLTAVREDHRGRPARRDRDTWYDERPSGHVNDAILPWLREPSDKPFFVWMHYWDPHHPHIAPPPYGEQYAHDPYQGEIAYADQSLGAILRDLEYRGELDNTIIVMTSDHGEGRGEHHEETHAFLAYDPTLHVPLIMQVPGGNKGKRVVERVGTVDIVPTLLDLLGIEAPAAIQGRSLVSLMEQVAEQQPRNRRRYYSESMSPRFTHNYGELRALYWGPYKFIHGPRSELFNLVEDPGELSDLINTRPELRQELETGLLDFVTEYATPVAAGATHDFDDDVRRRLAALGYLSTGSDSTTTISEELRTDGIPPQDRVSEINLEQKLRQLLSGEQYQRAEQTLLELLKKYPDHAYYQAKLALVYVGMQQIDDAAQVVDSTTSIQTAHASDYLNVAEALFERGDRDRGLQMAKRIAQSAGTSTTYMAMARMLDRLGEKDAVLDAIESALELDATNIVARIGLARYKLDNGDLGEARDLLVQLLTDYPIHADSNLLYARLLDQTRHPEQALSRLDRSLVFWPGNCEIHLQRLQFQVELGMNSIYPDSYEQIKKICRDEETLIKAANLLENNDAS